MSELKKTCFKCGKTKPLTEFYKHPEMSDGHLGKCKSCTKKDTRQNRNENLEYYRKYDIERAKTEKRKTYHKNAQRKRRENNPDKYHAHNAVNNAIRDNRLIPQPCEVCGSHETEAHHDDYSKPLSVRWLCFYHHRKIHGNYKET